ncbi:MAG: phosphate ABC transporter ATP-binding protein [Candidatus Omnitrophica bacterium]|jgi:phosphate transport system ATP-binding protein|nr:phosphate ABC transporter ATP-binding protein [Candidatus Omnitrophota bacterium]
MVSISVKKLNIWFGQSHVLRDLTIDVNAREILTIIGPANSGKTTFLRMLNKLNHLQVGFKMTGSVQYNSLDLSSLSAEEIRRKIGMVFAMPLPLPLSIFDNVAYGARMNGINKHESLEGIVQDSLKKAYIWDEVKDRLNESAFKLSGGQQQRLCIARTLAVSPEVILFDEPCSGLDPISTAKVEEAMLKLKEKYTIILVTNNVKQAARVGDKTAFFLNGELVELDKTEKMFTTPHDQRTNDYISGKFG